jgi:hypothetical protein
MQADIFEGNIMSRIDQLTARKLHGGRLVALKVLARQFGGNPLTVYHWARRSAGEDRLPTINLCGWRYTTLQAFAEHVVKIYGANLPPEIARRVSR